MKIGVDISQIIYEGTGVAFYTKHLIDNLLKIDKKNKYILFFASKSKQITNSDLSISKNSQVQIKNFRIPVKLLEFLWNKLHILPIEWLIGDIDVFFASDWLFPPTIKAKKVTTIHDLFIFKTAKSFDRKILSNQKKRLKWVKKECDLIICDSRATKKDAIEILGIEEKRLKVIYPGIIIANLPRS